MDIWTEHSEQSVAHLTVAGEAWLASASEYPSSLRALWEARPWAPTVLPCGRAFDVISLPALFGRRVLDELWSSGPGCGPVAEYRGRTQLFVQPGAAPRLRTLLAWEEWARDVPPLLCHGLGDAVTVPPVRRAPDQPTAPGAPIGRWIVAPDTSEPWLPSAGVLLWACVRAARGVAQAPQEGLGGTGGQGSGPTTIYPRPSGKDAAKGAPLAVFDFGSA
ncbi:bifunctional DNA primase/polymerase [Kitasatospora kifunensis]|uniref:bifunctional DNA primase/polymerase n=1 Tax=Kitasatospora kifunensis TaxID=58351 RepID=UPI0016171AD9|nr:bifunctional DNA primase/polymerase [Kitasatospora kifunensis]